MAKMGLEGIPSAEGVSLLINEIMHGKKSEDWILFAPFSTLNYSLQAAPVYQESHIVPAVATAANAI